MWKHRFEHRTSLPVDAIWPVIADVARWPEVDRNIERLDIAEAPAAGTSFRLKPVGGPLLSFVITRFDAPTTYADLCRLPLAAMTTTHTLVRGEETTIRVTIEITGPLAWLWGAVVGRRHAAGLPAQTERILAAARTRSRSAA